MSPFFCHSPPMPWLVTPKNGVSAHPGSQDEAWAVREVTQYPDCSRAFGKRGALEIRTGFASMT
jgi:hypothetical protein